MQFEQENLRRELEAQKYNGDRYPKRSNSREKELDALAMLDGYSKSVVKRRIIYVYH